MVEDHTTLAMVILGIVGVVGLVGLFMFMSKGGGADSSMLLVQPTQNGGWMLIRSNSLEQAGFKKVS